MLNGTYKVAAETPLGKKNGTIEFSGAKDSGKGKLGVKAKIDGIGFKISSATYEGDTFKIEGEVSMFIVKAPFVLTGKVAGDKLTGNAKSGDNGIKFTGKRA